MYTTTNRFFWDALLLDDPHEIVGQSDALQYVRDLIESTDPGCTNVLVLGERGTGKELVARAIHDRSTRRNGPFISIHCGSMPETLLESALFGHATCAYAGAGSAERGLFAEAKGGTLFLDDVDELPVALLPKLARALRDRTARAIGGEVALAFDVRVIGATSRDLEGEALPDAARIDVPPLRVRGGDVVLLAQHFVEKYAMRYRKNVASVRRDAERQLVAYHWPGNVRELETSIELAVRRTTSPLLTVDDLPPRILSRQSRVFARAERRAARKDALDRELAPKPA